MTAVGVRLFVRANLEGRPVAGRFAAPLTERVLRPLVAGLRAEAGLPGLDERPMTRGERDLAMTLHGSLMFLGIRKHVYRMPIAEDWRELVPLQLRVWLPGAIRELRRLHGASAEPSLTVEQLRPRGRAEPTPPPPGAKGVASRRGRTSRK
jgi:hypothetical protein